MLLLYVKIGDKEMLNNKLLLATSALIVIFSYDCTHAYEFGDITKSIFNKVKNSDTGKAVNNDVNTLKNATLQGISNIGGRFYNDGKNMAIAAGQNISNRYSQKVSELTSTASGKQEQNETDYVQAVNAAYAATAGAKAEYEAKKQTNSTPEQIYKAAADYDVKAKEYENTAIQAEKAAEERFAKANQEYQNASANLNYTKSAQNSATNFRIEADKALQEAQAKAAALPASM